MTDNKSNEINTDNQNSLSLAVKSTINTNYQVTKLLDQHYLKKNDDLFKDICPEGRDLPCFFIFQAL